MPIRRGAVADDHMAEIAAQFKLKEKVIVQATEVFNRERDAIIMYIGRVPEIAPGYWIGVQFPEKHGKNNGSINGVRYFECPADHGGFVRPNRIEKERPDRPPEMEMEVSPEQVAIEPKGGKGPKGAGKEKAQGKERKQSAGGGAPAADSPPQNEKKGGAGKEGAVLEPARTGKTASISEEAERIAGTAEELLTQWRKDAQLREAVEVSAPGGKKKGKRK